jgi:hypothetical protein
MGWGVACEVFHPEIVFILNSKTDQLNDAMVLRVLALRDDMIDLREMMRRLIRLYRNHGELVLIASRNSLTVGSVIRPHLEFINDLLARVSAEASANQFTLIPSYS